MSCMSSTRSAPGAAWRTRNENISSAKKRSNHTTAGRAWASTSSISASRFRGTCRARAPCCCSSAVWSLGAAVAP